MTLARPGATSAPEKEKKRAEQTRFFGRVKVRESDLIMFTRQMAAMMRTGIPITRCLETLAGQVDDPRMRDVIDFIYKRVSEGHMMSSALGQVPRVFTHMYVSMVRIGESTGALAENLEMLGGWMERDYQLMRKVKSALTYPIFVLILATVLTLGLFYSILPGFVKIFNEMQVELPLITKIVMMITEAVRNPGAWMVGLGVGAALYFFLRDQAATERGRIRFYRAALFIPVLGQMLRQAAMARFCSSMNALLVVGVDLVPALRLAANASGSPLLAQDSTPMSNALQEGSLLSEYLEARRDLYPASVIQMVSAGEEASNLDAMFARLGQFYNEEVNYLIEGFSAVLEPVMLAGVAIVVGTIVLSIFLPLYGFLNKLGA